MHNFQRDGHMQMGVPKGRVNYEPNSWAGANPREEPGPRESHAAGYRTFPAQVEGTKVRQRPETFADHYSQARQFYVSQTDIEKQHIQNALVFELSKVERPDIRARMVSHLLNIDQGLADGVAKGLRLKEMPKPIAAAKPTRQDLKPSDKLSIIKNGPKNFAGRKVGALVTDGTDADVLAALDKAVKAEGATLVLVAPEVGGFKDSAGAAHDAHEKLEGGPSVLFDAVAVIPSKEGAALLAELPAARDFVADAYAHRKFVGYSPAAAALFEKAGVARDEGFVPLGKAGDADAFVAACRKVRFWARAGAER
jgi:catalase